MAKKEKKGKNDLSGELEVEQDPGLPRAGHPRRHLAGSCLIEMMMMAMHVVPMMMIK